MKDFFYKDILLDENEFVVEKMVVNNAHSMDKMHVHNFFEVYFLENGNRTYFIKNNTYKMYPGSIAIIPPNTLHKTIGSDGSSYSRLLLQFSDKAFIFPSLAEKFMNIFGSIRLPSKEQVKMHSLFIQMKDCYYSDDKFRYELMKIYINEIVVYILSQPPMQINKPVDILINKVIDHINIHYNEKLSLKDLSNIFNISIWHLSRTFKKQTSFSVVSYINCVRIMNARIMIKETNMSITKIANEIGFESLTHFERVFKNLSGISAKEFRKL